MNQMNRQPRRFLFVLWDGGGNIPPQLALARHLAERGHRVRILAPRVLRERIEAAGCIYVPLTYVPEHSSISPTDDLLRDWEARSSLGAAMLARDRLIFGTALAYGKDVLAAIAEERPDVVASDYLLLGAYAAAERSRVPLAALIHMVYPLSAPGMPPYGMGLQPMSGVAGRARDAIFMQIFRRFYNARLGELNETRAVLGLAPLTSVFQQFDHADRILVMTSQAFDFPATSLPPNVRYVGPQLDDSAWLQPWKPLTTEDDERPLVLVSLSTTYQRQEDVVRRVVAALADLPVRGLVTLGPALRQQAFSFPPNVWSESYAPHTLVCPYTDLVVTHGGHGTIMAALSAGVPLVCLPMGRDQGENAARVRWHGVGVRRSHAASVAELRQAIRLVLKEPRYRERAREIAKSIARQGGPSEAIQEIELLAASSAGRVRERVIG